MQYIRTVKECDITIPASKRAAANAAARQAGRAANWDELDPDNEWAELDEFLREYCWESVYNDDGSVMPYYTGVLAAEIQTVIEALAGVIEPDGEVVWIEQNYDIWTATFDGRTVTYDVS